MSIIILFIKTLVNLLSNETTDYTDNTDLRMRFPGRAQSSRLDGSGTQ